MSLPKDHRSTIVGLPTLDQPLTFLDFFAGVGLVEKALEPKWQCLWANDIDPKKQSIYTANFADSKRYFLGDVSAVTVDQIPMQAHMAWASFPCQDLSLAGYRKGINAKRSGVFWSFHRLMHQLKEGRALPGIIVIENVVGLLYGENFTGLCEALNDLGMRFGALVIDAKRFVPQSRPRVFIIAVDQSLNTEAFETSKESTQSQWISEALRASVDRLPAHLQARWIWWSLRLPTDELTPVAHLIEEEPSSVSWHTPAETNRLLQMMNEVNRAKVDQALESAELKVGFLYKRTRNGEQRAEVRFDGIAGCLRTPNGGSSRQTVLLVEKGKMRSRLLSSREAARLMGAPDTFQLPGTYNDAYKAMGDGVALPAVAWLAEHLLTPLAIAERLRIIGTMRNLPLILSPIETVNLPSAVAAGSD